jgi:hypothetical protein
MISFFKCVFFCVFGRPLPCEDDGLKIFNDFNDFRHHQIKAHFYLVQVFMYLVPDLWDQDDICAATA